MSRLLPERLDEPVGEPLGFRTLVDSLPVGLLWLDETGKALQWNEIAEGLLHSANGVRLEELIERLVVACRTTQTCIQTAMELTGTDRVQVAVAPDRTPGTYLVVLDRQRLERARTEASVLRGVLKAVASTSSREEALQKALETVHSALSATHLAFFELDEARLRLACVASSGLSPDEITDAVALRNNADTSLLAATLQYGQPITLPDLSKHEGQVPFRTGTGLKAVMYPVRGRGSQGVLYVSTRDTLTDGFLRLCAALADAVGAVLDLATLEREANRAREVATQRDRLATIGQLVAGVAHEINNPLAFLKSNLHSLRVDLDDLRAGKIDPMSEVNEIVTESLEGVSRIETIVQALKGTARKKDERIRFEPTRAVNEAITIFRGAHKQDCDIDCSGLTPIPEVMGSPSALGQVTLNLLQNGLDSMSTFERRKRKLVICSKVDGDRLVISYRDHGTGIPLDVQKRMFDAFYTTKDPGKGTGLGLAISKEIAESMGGSLTFTTGSDGTCFELTLKADRDTD
jgi:C4-dicarboxylate-specific signal transduction histidine kinase